MSTNKYGFPLDLPWPPGGNTASGDLFGQGLANALTGGPLTGGLGQACAATAATRQQLLQLASLAQQQQLSLNQMAMAQAMQGVFDMRPKPHNLGKEVLEELISPKALRGKK